MKKRILIDGMSCGHCVAHVKEALLELDGVKVIDVNLSSKSALVEVEENVKENILKDAIEDLGYEFLKIEEA